jgi:glucokinase-like ROK family protein
VVTGDGRLLWSDVVPTPAAGGRPALLNTLRQVSRQALDRSRASAIGIATAGWVDPATGRVAYATDNLPGWTGTPIADEIGAATGLPVYVENDANALAVAEKEFGAARDFSDFVCITLGTGVGGGIYAGGRLNRGAHFFANAVGHMSVDPEGEPCNCGQRGCLETYANAAALLRYAGNRFTSAEQVIAAARRGELLALDAVRLLAHHLAVGCAAIVQLVDPQAIILAGGLAQDNPVLLEAFEQELSKRVTVWDQRKLQVRASVLGYHAGVLGGAAIARSRMALAL